MHPSIFFLGFFLFGSLSLTGQAFKLDLMAMPSLITPGEWVQLKVQTTDRGGNPLGRVNVTIQAGGGLFASTRNASVEGKTDSKGVFRASWTCDPCEEEYLIQVQAHKFRYGEAVDSVWLNVEVPTLQSPPGYQLSVLPPQAAPGDPVNVRVAAFRGTVPMEGLKVELSASGGQFTEPLPHSVENYVVGTTDSLGLFRARWHCRDCASKYHFDLRLTMPGSPPLRGRASVTIDPSSSNTSLMKSGTVTGRMLNCRDCGFLRVEATPLQAASEPHSVQLSTDCRFRLSLSPGLYHLQPVSLKKEFLEKKKITPQRIKVNVTAGMETVVNFQCAH